MTVLKRRFIFNRWGLAENPVGAQVVTNAGKLYDVVGVYRREFPQAFMLNVRNFDGSAAPDIAASAVYVLLRDWEEKS